MRIRPIKTDERGISAVVVSVSLVAIFSALLLSLDAGNLWQTRRNLITGTDATALGAARDMARDLVAAPGTFSGTCPSGWATILTSNIAYDPGSATCVPTQLVGSQSGYVTVAAQKTAAVRFGGVLNIGDKPVYSMSAALWGMMSRAQGLRPIGICVNDHHIQEWLTIRGTAAYNGLPTTEPAEHYYYNAGDGQTHIVHRVYFTRSASKDLACGNDPGNWGWQDFNGGSNSESELKSWLLDGYGSLVGIGDCNADGKPDGCSGDTGAHGGNANSCSTSTVAGTLQCLTNKEFPVVVYTSANCSTSGKGGGGSNCTFTVGQFIGVTLRCFNFSGTGNSSCPRLAGDALRSGQDGRYFDVEFSPIVVPGPCCDRTAAIDTGVRGVRLCAVDHDPVTEAVRCS